MVEEKKLGGVELIDTVASMTGLPGELAHHEIDQILTSTGQDSKSLTLEQFRQAMLAYLEAISADMEVREQGESSQDSSDSDS